MVNPYIKQPRIESRAASDRLGARRGWHRTARRPPTVPNLQRIVGDPLSDSDPLYDRSRSPERTQSVTVGLRWCLERKRRVSQEQMLIKPSKCALPGPTWVPPFFLTADRAGAEGLSA